MENLPKSAVMLIDSNCNAAYLICFKDNASANGLEKIYCPRCGSELIPNSKISL